MPSIRVVWRKLVSRLISCGVVFNLRANSAGRTFCVTITFSNNTLADKLAGSSTAYCPRF